MRWICSYWAAAGLCAAAACADVVHVKSDATGTNDGTSWTDAFNSLQDALAAAQLGDEIWVAAGVYRPDQGAAQTPGDRTAYFHILRDTAAALYGGFDGTEVTLEERAGLFDQTILDGDLNSDDTPEFGNRGDNSAELVGNFGARTIDGFSIRGSEGYAALTSYRNRAEIRNCEFRQNRGWMTWSFSYGGGALFVGGRDSVVESCQFIENTAALGGAVYQGWNTVYRACRFERNTADFGGAVYVTDSAGDARFVRSTFIGNSASYVGGAIRCISGTNDFQLQDCRFLGNTAEMGFAYGYGGGAICTRGTQRLIAVNCEFSGNRTQAAGYHDGGGAIMMSLARRAILEHCTFAGNESRAWGGAIAIRGNLNGSQVDLHLNNCVLAGNPARFGTGALGQAAAFDSFSMPTVAINCCIEGYSGEFDGEGNISVDPQFVDPDGADNIFGTEDDDLRLGAGSRCIDAGANAEAIDRIDADGDGDTTEPLEFDLAGNPRFLDDPDTPDTGSGAPPIVDMGAYEGTHQAILTSARQIDVAENGEAAFSVRLAARPDTTVSASVHVSEGDPAFTVTDGATLTFTPADWNTPHPVTVALADDLDWLNSSAVVQVNAGALSREVRLSGLDDEPAPPILYVRPGGAGLGGSWDDAFGELRDALAAVHNRPESGEVWVAAGEYRPAPFGGDQSASFRVHSGVAIRGGFGGYETELSQRDIRANRTILSGDLLGNDQPFFQNREDNCYSVVTAVDVNSAGILDGFVIRGGYSLPYPTGADAGPDARLTGGGLHATGGAPLILNCRFYDNFGAEGGAIALPDSTATLISCVIDNNLSEAGGGGVRITRLDETRSTGPRLIQCVVTNNETQSSGAGGVGAAPGAKIQNSIIFSNVNRNGDRPQDQVNSSGEYSHCIIGDRPGGPNSGGYACFGANPQFVDADGPDNIPATLDDDYRLSPGSPAIDVGCNASLGRDHADIDGDRNTDELIPLDLNGNPRIADDPATPDAGCGALGVVDIGAYEFPGTPAGACFGDLDGDGAVALADLQRVVSAYGADPADPRWDCDADVTCDGNVDFEDLAIILSVYGVLCP